MRLLLGLITAGTAEDIGRKVLILGYFLKLDGVRTLDDLAERFSSGGKPGVSRARVSQILSALNQETRDFSWLTD